MGKIHDANISIFFVVPLFPKFKIKLAMFPRFNHLLIFDDNSEIGAYVRNNLCNLILLGYKIESSCKSNIFSSLFSCMCAQHVLSYHLIKVPGA